MLSSCYRAKKSECSSPHLGGSGSYWSNEAHVSDVCSKDRVEKRGMSSKEQYKALRSEVPNSIREIAWNFLL
jgi:hypothetical protein